MPARVPLDVDIEDKLLYGLTPTRLVYLIFAFLAAFSVWSSHWALMPVRAGAATVLMIFGAVAAWGRWRARPVDRWLTDIIHFTLATYRMRWNLPRR